MRKIYLIIIIIFGQIVGLSQIDYRPPPKCYIVNNLETNQPFDLVSSLLDIKIKSKKNNEIIFLLDKTLYFYKNILWRIEYKNKYILCKYDINNIYLDDDVKVYFDGKNTNITNISIYNRILLENKKEVNNEKQ